ncbi:MAG TPA: peptidylprolyl isomerase, partial [Bacteroidetes bacterium]|nr:peptidylprolyl isomerase [Bacteroidota bacterium]
MKKTGIALIVIAFAAFSGLFSGCDSNKGAQKANTTSKNDPVLLNFPGKVTVQKSEFEYVYQKNNGGWDKVKDHTPEQYREYLDLYINFKRKVLEAESLGLHETDAFTNEFEGYRKQLAQPYLVEKSVQEKLINEAYERSKELVSASHILIMVGPDAPAADTAKALAKANALRDSVVNHGKSFAEMAQKYSEDPSAKQNKGLLGYFGVFDMVYPFETGAYSTPVGQVSQPIRSGYGYHLISVNDRIKNTGKKTAAHLIIRVGAQYSAKTEDQADAKMKEIYNQLKQGANWDELCKKYSDDPNTAQKGGDLGNGRLIPEMEDLKRKLNKGEFSEPFKSAFGHHILKVTDMEPVKSFEEAKSEIKSRVARDARSTLSRDFLIARVKRDYNFKMNKETVAKLVKAIEDQKQESAYNRGFWRPVDSLHKSLYDLPVYTLGKGENAHTGTLQDFINHYTKTRKGYEAATVSQTTDKFMEAFIEDEMLAFEERQLPKKYREYRELIKEYRDGILL